MEMPMGMMPPQQQAPQLNKFAFFMFAEFLIVAGMLFILLGIARALGDYIGFGGSGEALLGLLMLIGGYAIAFRTRPKRIIIGRGPPPPAPPMQKPPPQPPPSESSYR